MFYSRHQKSRYGFALRWKPQHRLGLTQSEKRELSGSVLMHTEQTLLAMACSQVMSEHSAAVP